MSHLRFGKKAIKSTYLIKQANFVACHNPAYVRKYNMVQELVPGGTFLLNCSWSPEELETHLPVGVIVKICLCIHVCVVSDNLDGVLVRTNRTGSIPSTVSRLVKKSDLADVSIRYFSLHSSNWLTDITLDTVFRIPYRNVNCNTALLKCSGTRRRLSILDR